MTKQSGNSRRRLNPARWLVQGAFRECISHQEEGHALTHSGTFLVFMEYILFVALSLFGGFTAPVNISICGYMELLPDWVAFLYCHVAAAGVDSTLWHAAVKFKTEPNLPSASSNSSSAWHARAPSPASASSRGACGITTRRASCGGSTPARRRC